MKQSDRTRLTTVLRGHVAKIAADLLAKIRAPGRSRVRAEQLYLDERVSEDFEVWTDLLSRRAAVLWVLKSVYVRVLEDRGLLAPGRLVDPEAQQLFERLAPHLGETAFLRWIYRDLASQHGGLPELFSPQPAEVALPSDELSRALIAFWRHRDADTGAVWGFAEERFEGELMGDLYQELDPVVKDRFALCQTPDFVRGFILDRTLTPAIETFGAGEVRLLDPACGSGHFLIDALKRLFVGTAEEHPEWPREVVVRHTLDRVVGMDLNDYACALARTRLVMTAAELAGISSLTDASQFHPHVYWADGLEQVERAEIKPSVQTSFFENVSERPIATLSRSDVRAALRKVLATRFHVVVANPPYITERDPSRRDYHREKVGKLPRFTSAYREYSLGAPFTERCFQLACDSGYVGIITSNNFMKREFGKPLIERVLADLDLTLVVDTSHAAVLQRDATTVLLFGRKRLPQSSSVRVVMGRRGETSNPTDPARGLVWVSILHGWQIPGFENDFISVADLSRVTLSKHPWTIAGGGAAALREQLEATATHLLASLGAAGTGAVTREDDVYVIGRDAAERMGVPTQQIRPLVEGDVVRDWSINRPVEAIWPYDPQTLDVVSGTAETAIARALWPWRFRLWRRVAYGKSHIESGLPWFAYSMFFAERFRIPLSIAFPAIASHNHFVLDSGGKVFKQSAPAIKLKPGATEEDYLALLGLLNSSTLAFWMRQVFYIKGGQSTGKKRQSEAWARRLDYDATKLGGAPLVTAQRDRVLQLTKRLNALAQEYAALDAAAILGSRWSPDTVEGQLAAADTRRQRIRQEMIALQEELDWTVYVAFNLAAPSEIISDEDIEPIPSEHRPFAVRLARAVRDGNATSHWFESMGVQRTERLPDSYSEATRMRSEQRVGLIGSGGPLGILEAPEYKRKWEPANWRDETSRAAFEWLATRVESALKTKDRALSVQHIVAALQDDKPFLAVASLYQLRRDVDLDGLVGTILCDQAVPNHRFHVYTESGLAKREAWERVWAIQRRQDAGEKVAEFPAPPEYSQGSRGKSIDFLNNEFWRLRGKLDVPKERFIAFTEIPDRGVGPLYGWAGWTLMQRLKAILSIDEEMEDSGIILKDRAGLLDSAWRLLADGVREDPIVATRLKAELQALAGPDGPSRELIEEWKERFPPPKPRSTRGRRIPVAWAEDEDSDSEESDES